MVLKLHNLIDTLGVLTLASRQLGEEWAAVAEEPAAIADDPTWPAGDPFGAAEKSIEELFDEAYTKDSVPNDVLGQLRRGQTRSNQLSLAECQEDDNG